MFLDFKGDIAHDCDCTWCKHRLYRPGKGRKRGVELCLLSGRPIPGPTEPGRYCDRYSAINCDCEDCVRVDT